MCRGIRQEENTVSISLSFKGVNPTHGQRTENRSWINEGLRSVNTALMRPLVFVIKRKAEESFPRAEINRHSDAA